MTGSKIPPTAIAIATYVIVSGIFEQSGIILQPAAAYFHTSVTDTAVLFSYVSAGNVSGILVSLFAFNVATIRTVLLLAYACMFAGVAAVALTHALPIACVAVYLIGLGVGTGLSAGAVILAKLYVDRARAVAFLSTDCAFSAAGFVVPALVAAAIAARWPWQSGYVFVAIVAAAACVAIFFIELPHTGRAKRDANVSIAPAAPRSASREERATVALFALGIFLYLTGQTTFTIWAPTVLHDLLGVDTLRAGEIVSSFFGPSSLGLVTAAVLVSRIEPRFVLVFALVMGAASTLLLSLTADAQAFFVMTFAFGFTTTCMFKLMISIGSEQLPSMPPALVTFLLFCSGLGSTAAPLISAQIVRGAGLHASLWLSFACYAATLMTIGAALVLERSARLGAPRPRTAAVS
jgi:TsgA-like MFS transporter